MAVVIITALITTAILLILKEKELSNKVKGLKEGFIVYLKSCKKAPLKDDTTTTYTSTREPDITGFSIAAQGYTGTQGITGYMGTQGITTGARMTPQGIIPDWNRIAIVDTRLRPFSDLYPSVAPAPVRFNNKIIRDDEMGEQPEIGLGNPVSRYDIIKKDENIK